LSASYATPKVRHGNPFSKLGLLLNFAMTHLFHFPQNSNKQNHQYTEYCPTILHVKHIILKSKKERKNVQTIHPSNLDCHLRLFVHNSCVDESYGYWIYFRLVVGSLLHNHNYRNISCTSKTSGRKVARIQLNASAAFCSFVMLYRNQRRVYCSYSAEIND